MLPGLDRRARSGLRGLEDDVGGFPAFSGLADSELLADLERIAAAITEVHPNPDAVLDRDGEWFEVLNPGPRALDLEGVAIDRVAYDEGWPHAAGQAMQLDPTAIDPVLNDEPERWCAASEPYGIGDLGSPGEPNPACAP